MLTPRQFINHFLRQPFHSLMKKRPPEHIYFAKTHDYGRGGGSSGDLFGMALIFRKEGGKKNKNEEQT